MDTALEASDAPSDLPDAQVTVAPSREDPLVRRFSAVVGGPAGGRIRPGRHGWWTAARVLVVLAMVALSFGVVEKQHCRAQGWTSPDQFFHACYSDLPLLYETSGIAQGLNPFGSASGGSLGQPVLTGLLTWAVGSVTPHGTVIQRDRWYFDIGTGAIALLVIALVLLTVASTGRRRPWDASLVALSPLLALSRRWSRSTCSASRSRPLPCWPGDVRGRCWPACCSAWRSPRAATRSCCCSCWPCWPCAPGSGAPGCRPRPRRC